GHFRQVLAERSDFLPGWLGLTELLLAGHRWVDLDEALSHAEAAMPAGATDLAAVRARGHLARREFGPARTLLEKVIVEVPRALHPRVVLSHVLLQENRDTAAAER